MKILPLTYIDPRITIVSVDTRYIESRCEYIDINIDGIYNSLYFKDGKYEELLCIPPSEIRITECMANVIRKKAYDNQTSNI